MRYEKPQIAPLASAIDAIQCSHGKIGGAEDGGCEIGSKPTADAYEADE
jgi:hypothetical protein